MPEVWYWPPNSINETLVFKTEVQTTRTQERRVSYMDASQRFTYGYVATAKITEEMIGLYLPDTTTTFYVPEWPTATFDRSLGVTVADTVIPVDDSVVYVVGQQVILGRGENWEQGEVDSVGTGQVVLTSGVSATYGASQEQPFFVAPLIECLIPNRINFSSAISRRRLSVEFLSVAPVDIGENPYTLFNSLPFVNDAQVILDDKAGSAGQVSVLADSGFGVYQVVLSEEYTRRGGTLSFFDYTYADRMKRRQFYHFMRGRDGEMYVPSNEPDLELNASFSSSALTLNIKPVTLAAEMVGKIIYVQVGSSTVAKVITGATDNSLTSQTIQFSGTIGFEGTPSNALVSFVNKFRFDEDEVNINYSYSKDGLIASSSNTLLESA